MACWLCPGFCYQVLRQADLCMHDCDGRNNSLHVFLLMSRMSQCLHNAPTLCMLSSSCAAHNSPLQSTQPQHAVITALANLRRTDSAPTRIRHIHMLGGRSLEATAAAQPLHALQYPSRAAAASIPTKQCISQSHTWSLTVPNTLYVEIQCMAAHCARCM